jgi:large subunit ribosomal protein L9e
VTVSVKARTVTVKGPRGTLERTFKSNSFSASMVGKQLMRVDILNGKRAELACLRTITTHIENMMTGVKDGYEFKMRFAYAHFPINVTCVKAGEKHTVEIRNFLGERKLRSVVMAPGVTVKRSENVKDEITLQGNDLELVSGSAARVHESCLVKNKDIRKFLDGLCACVGRGPGGACCIKWGVSNHLPPPSFHHPPHTTHNLPPPSTADVSEKGPIGKTISLM